MHPLMCHLWWRSFFNSLPANKRSSLMSMTQPTHQDLLGCMVLLLLVLVRCMSAIWTSEIPSGGTKCIAGNCSHLGSDHCSRKSSILIRGIFVNFRFKQEPPPPWSAITTSLGVAVIVLLVGHIFHAAINRIEKVEDDYRAMRDLKGRAEAADVAKSRVSFFLLWITLHHEDNSLGTESVARPSQCCLGLESLDI